MVRLRTVVSASRLVVADAALCKLRSRTRTSVELKAPQGPNAGGLALWDPDPVLLRACRHCHVSVYGWISFDGVFCVRDRCLIVQVPFRVGSRIPRAWPTRRRVPWTLASDVFDKRCDHPEPYDILNALGPIENVEVECHNARFASKLRSRKCPMASNTVSLRIV